MKCKFCENENPETNIFCGNCGEKLTIIGPVDIETGNKSESEFESSKYTEVNDSQFISKSSENEIIDSTSDENTIINENSKVIPIIVSLSVVIILFGILLGKFIIPYNKAINNISSSKYELAINELSSLGNYRESANLIVESKYKWALQALGSKDYQKAIDLFSSIDNYQDSKNYLLNAKYLQAFQFYEEGKFEDAIRNFTELGNYYDSSQLKTDAKYLLAEKKIKEQKFIEAEILFEELENYQNSSQHLFETRYILAKNNIKAGLNKEAIALLEKIVDYKVSNDLLKQSKYSMAILDYKNGDFITAKEKFEDIPDYKDSITYIEKLNVLNGIQGTWEDENGLTQYFFSGWKYYQVFYPNRSDTSVYEHELSEYSVNSNSISFLENGGTSKLLYKKGGYVLEDYWGETVSLTFRKLSNNTTPVAEKPNPRIGMTADQVRNSSWGSPEEINRTTTSTYVRNASK